MRRDDNDHLGRVYGPLRGPAAYHCECDVPGCNQRVVLDRGAYRAVRSDRRQLVVAPGHERAAHEVVADHGTYLVVREPDPFDTRD